MGRRRQPADISVDVMLSGGVFAVRGSIKASSCVSRSMSGRAAWPTAGPRVLIRSRGRQSIQSIHRPPTIIAGEGR